MVSFVIVYKSLSSLFKNFAQALRISLVPYLLYAISIHFLGLWLETLNLTIPDSQAGFEVGSFALVVFDTVAFFLVIGWIAVAWHRFVLRAETTRLVPPLFHRRVVVYAGKLFLLSLIVGALFALLGSIWVAAPTFLFWPIYFGGITMILALFLRLAVSLVATALQNPISFRKAWDATQPIANASIPIALLLIGLNLVGEMLANSAIQLGVLAVWAIDFVYTLFVVMLGISILTTLYGHVVEGRELPN